MSLSGGTRLGPYEIAGQIGAGGMGEVYRARDPRLGRDVAIKVLPPSFSQDADRLRRFEQEAKAAGVLNHPNITAVYDVGQHDGAPYVVQELLEGETLRSLLAGGRVPQRKIVDYSLQIVHGLAAAHEKGIVHRDLKPENVFVTNDGRAKILDFGLAKLTHTEETGPLTNMPTASAGTEPGVVMGTLGYMSPEQVRGKPADQRSDIFAFGAILYEMLSGKRAFHGDSAADTMSAILREDPPDLSITNQNVSPGLERIVRHCLEKNPEQRFHSAHDIAFALETLSGLSSTPRLEPSSAGVSVRRPSPIAGAAVLAGVALGLLAGFLIWRTRAASPPTFQRLTFRRGPVWNARFASDGNTIFYSASWDGAPKSDVYSTRVESPEALRLSLPDQVIQSISRTGEMLVLRISNRSTGYAATGVLSQAPLSGSASRELLEDVSDADWAPDGTSIAVVRAPQWRYRLEYPVGKLLYETTGYISHPRVSPQADAVAFLDHPLFGDDRGSVAIVDLAGRKKTLTATFDSVQGLVWSTSGRELWFTATHSGSARELWAVTLDGRERLVLATPGGLLLQDIARDGRVLVAQENARVGFFALLPGETREKDLSGLEWSYQASLSDDAKTAVFTEQGAAGGAGYSVYMRKLDGSAAVRLGAGLALAISPDGKWVLASQILTTPGTIVLLPTGAGQPKTFPKDSIDKASITFGAFLPDGKSVVYDAHEVGKPRRVYVQNLEGGPARPVTPEGVTASALSPDGKLLLTETPGRGFGLSPLDGGPALPVRGLEPRDHPLRWTADGRSLFVATRRELPARVLRVDPTSGRREVWKEFTPGDPTGITGMGADSISADGNTILFGYFHTMSELYLARDLR